MGFGDTADSEIKDAVLKKLDKWFSNPPDYDDVTQAYDQRGKLQAQRIALLRNIESIEDEILSDENNRPRSNDTRIKKLTATKKHRDQLTDVDMQLAEIENQCKLLEFRKSMFSSAVFRVKMQYEL